MDKRIRIPIVIWLVVIVLYGISYPYSGHNNADYHYYII